MAGRRVTVAFRDLRPRKAKAETPEHTVQDMAVINAGEPHEACSAKAATGSTVRGP